MTGDVAELGHLVCCRFGKRDDADSYQLQSNIASLRRSEVEGTTDHTKLHSYLLPFVHSHYLFGKKSRQ